MLSPTLIRLEYAADGRFEDSPTLTVPSRAGLGAKFKSKAKNGVRTIRTSAITLRYRIGSGPFSAANLTVKVGGFGTRRPSFPQSLGPTPGNLGGWYRGLDLQDGPVPLHDGILSREGWYVLDDTNSVLLRDGGFGFEERRSRAGAYQDGYLFAYGSNYGAALGDLRDLTGPAPLLPQKAYGVWFSRYQGYSENDYKRLLAEFRRNRVPLDVLVVDTDFKSPNDWNGWGWTKVYFPEPKRFLDWAHGKGLDVILNIHPSIATDDPSYPAANAAAGGLPDASGRCKRFVRDPNVSCGAWNWDEAEDVASYFALHEPFEAAGVDGWWLDWCCDESRVTARGLTPDTWINSLYANRSRARGSRWPVLSRIGGTYLDSSLAMSGVWAEHRSAIHFTGDTYDTWKMLDFQTEMTAAEGAGIGMPYVSHDIGSFHGDRLGSAMYVRWVQLGAFQPIMRFHSDHAPRLPWEYRGRARKIAAGFLRLRESLVPYLYTLARQAYDSGLPLARPMYLGSPESGAAYRFPHQYMLGPKLLVAPVAAAGNRARKRVWFPRGEWVDVFTGKRYRGARARTLRIPLSRMAVFARAGAIIPRAKNRTRVGRGAADPLLLDVYAGAAGSFTVYEDGGDGLDYQRGQSSRTELRWSQSARSAKLAIGGARGSYPGRPKARRYRPRIIGIAKPRRVTIAAGGKRRRAKFSYDSKARELTLLTGRVPSARGATVTLDLPRGRRGGRR